MKNDLQLETRRYSAAHVMPSTLLALALPVAGLTASASGGAARPPNVVIILADDLGYGDVKCYNPERGKILTPAIDRLAAEGMRFTDAHSSSAVCSPTRYALLTGRYHWRTRLQRGIVNYLEGSLIAPDRLTLADLLKEHGYRTAMVGKWHLGWDWNINPAQKALFSAPTKKPVDVTDQHLAAWREVYGRPIGGGPLACGFDEYFGVDVPNWPPFSFIEGDRVTVIPDTFLPVQMAGGALASLRGPAVKGWDLKAVLPALADRAVSFIKTAAVKPSPFFLYMTLTAPHTPISVVEEWKGKSGLNEYADFVMQTDAVVGRVMEALQKSGAAGNTLVVFTSDNGCSPHAEIAKLEAMGHYPSGPLRGYKYDAWEGGHRMPFIARWPGIVVPGSVCDQLVQQTDLMATLADKLGVKLPDNACEDGVSLLPLLKGGTTPVRRHAVSASVAGVPALRDGSWKIIFSKGNKGNENDPYPGQLYNLADDPGETNNLWARNPERVAELSKIMELLVQQGRSTPGTPQTNDVDVLWNKFLGKVDPNAPSKSPLKSAPKAP